MMHKAWCCLGEVPYCFLRSSVEFQGHKAKKIIHFDPNWAFPDWINGWLWNDAQTWSSIEEVPYFCSRSSIKFQGRSGQKNHWFWPQLSFSGMQLKFGFAYGFEMMHKAWCSIEDVPYCILRSSIKFQGHTGQKIDDFDPNLAFPDCNSSFNSPMALKWCTKLDLI